MHESLKLRPSKIIALCRLALAAILLVASWLDPSSPLVGSLPGMALLFGYLTYSSLAMAIALKDWWMTHQLRYFAFAIDIVTAFLVLYLIESSHLNLPSPFLGFFIFLVLTSTLIWPQRTVVAVVAGILAGYAAIGLLLAYNGTLADPSWYVRRMAYMAVLASLLVWFGHTRTAPRPDRLDWPFETPLPERFAIIVDFARGQLQAEGAAILWSPADEPWVYLDAVDIAGHRGQRLPPEVVEIESWPGWQAILFNRLRHRHLYLTDDGRIDAHRGQISLVAAKYLGIDTGILVPIVAETGTGLAFLTGVQGISADHLKPAQALGREIGMAIDRHALAEQSHAAELASLRLSMARDLHDSVAQSLAGVSFRLKALSGAHQSGRDIASDLEDLRFALTREQQNVQAMIAQMSNGHADNQDSNLHEAMQLIQHDAEKRWGIGISLACESPQVSVPISMVRQIERLINEAVANAVRHGDAQHVDLVAQCSSNGLQLTIANQTGKPVKPGFVPRTIADRVEDLGGVLEILDDQGQTIVRISLPLAS